MNRVVLIVLDSLGIGAMPDAENYGDAGADTLGHIAASKTDFSIPNLIKMGLGNIDGVSNIAKEENPAGSFGRLGERSKGKDTITGHWEIAGLLTEVPFQTFPDGFPKEFMKEFEAAIGRETLGNYAASGTEIIEKLGPEHEKTGRPIIYTSADSVFQIAVNTAVIPLEELYQICETARKMLIGDLQVGRVIARPYILENGKRIRTSDRKDYAVSPTGKTLLDHVKDSGKKVYAIGKISDIFNGQGVTTSVHTDSNQDGITKTIEALRLDFSGLIFTNLVDFDSKYGHRRDPIGYGRCIEEFDRRLPEILEAMKEEDVLILCADHGNDPVHSGWDHTREYVPVLLYGKTIKSGMNLGTRKAYADIGATIAEMLSANPTVIGESFFQLLKKI
ncbi:phosphopentomutase [Sinanaerobacter chloroacetimidivorans]|uniref:Phosphopentomutase n=1 Tax=Sinanaerobacter chloroacetimidivorans TaxID=2818044 RepID=A0A8J7W343_9FIRM|nr:phosphopentomutase [Sinanaerobacter chloroacetimidivorans]MBR0600002.1 phosphopentomutase [Sinanaerobacter chloroacetimidivorans]